MARKIALRSGGRVLRVVIAALATLAALVGSSFICRVVIAVKTLRGQRKVTFSPRPYGCGKLVSYCFRCSLPRGTYRFFVTTWDGAANRSAKSAWNYLTVT